MAFYFILFFLIEVPWLLTFMLDLTWNCLIQNWLWNAHFNGNIWWIQSCI